MVRPLHIDLPTHWSSFVDDLGNRKTYCGFNAFKLLEMELHGQDTGPWLDDFDAVLEEVRRIAANTGDGAWLMPVLRVAGMGDQSDNQVMTLYPQNTPDFYNRTRAIVDKWAERDYYTDIDVFINTKLVMPDRPNPRIQLDHWTAMGQAFVGCPPIFLSIANEASHSGQRVDVYRFPAPPPGIMWTRGSEGAGEDPPRLDGGAHYLKYHGKRGGTKGQLAATDAKYAQNGYTDENTGQVAYPGSNGHPVIVEEFDHSNVSSIDWYWHGMYAGRCGGGDLHLEHMQHGLRLDAQDFVCAKAFVMGLAKGNPAQR